MRICYDADQLEAAMAAVHGHVLLDRFVENAIELDVDALCDGEEVYIAAVMQHVEEAGVHSGDSACVLPAPSLTLAAALEVEHVVKRLGPALGVVGILNVQLAIADAAVYVLEVNPRASRTVPFASKAIGINLVDAACRLAAGATLARARPAGPAPDAGQREGGRPAVLAVSRCGPRARAGDALDRRGHGERRRPADGTGEGRARGGQAAARPPVPPSSPSGTRTSLLRSPVAAALAGLGFELVATEGTARTLRAAGLDDRARSRRSRTPTERRRRSSISSAARAATS